MATPTTTIPRPNSGGRRTGPMNPEEMLDLRNQELKVDEELVNQLVEEAKADYSENLLEPIWALTHPKAVKRHRARFGRVMGTMARWKSGGKDLLLLGGVFGGVFGALHFNQEFGLGMDLFFTIAFTALLRLFVVSWAGYQEVFRKVYAVERRDFTDPGYVTGVVRTFLPSLCYYNRPEVWRGDDGNNGIRNPKSFVVLACGQDEITWHENFDPDSDVWCGVKPGPMIVNFRSPVDYYDLPPDTFTTDGISMAHRRAWCRDLQRKGEAFADWEKEAAGALDGKWGWIAGGAMLIAGVFIIVIAYG